MKMDRELPPKKRRAKYEVAIIFLEVKNRGLDMRKPLSVFEILFKMKVKKSFAFKQVDFYPFCRVLVENHFAFHTQLHFAVVSASTNPVSPHFQQSGKWLVNS